LERKTLVRVVELPGRAEAFEVAPLHAKVTGYIDKVAVDIGDRVTGPSGDTPGTLICQLDVPELKEEELQKQAMVLQAKAGVTQATAEIQVAQAVLLSAQAKVQEAEALAAREESRYARWKSEYERVTQLAASGAVSTKVADETLAELSSADAGRKEVVAKIASAKAMKAEAEAHLEKSKADAIAASSQLAVAEADERRAAVMLEYTAIRAPFDGIVVERNVHPGQLVQAGSQQAALLTVMRVDPIRVVLEVPEIDAVAISPQSQIDVKMAGLVHSGTITRTSWSLNKTSRTLKAEVDLPNAAGRVRPGQYLQVLLKVAQVDHALALPKPAVVTIDKQTCCYAVDDAGVVRKVPIELGLLAGNESEVRSGLTGTERVILLNASSFREGQAVEVVPPAPPAK
jgi:RND family efflux transporter MFP subunit